MQLAFITKPHSFPSTSGTKVSSECITRSRIAGGRVFSVWSDIPKLLCKVVVPVYEILI